MVKQVLNNYVNVAMMWKDIQVGLPYWFSLFFVYTKLCVGDKMCLCARTLRACVSVGVKCCDKTSALWLKGGKRYLHSISLTLHSLPGTLKSIFMRLQHAPTPTIIYHILHCTHSLNSWPNPRLTFNHSKPLNHFLHTSYYFHNRLKRCTDPKQH